MQAALVRGGQVGALPTTTARRADSARAPLTRAPCSQQEQRHRAAVGAAPRATGSGGGGKGWLGNLPSWPSRDDGRAQQQEEEEDDDDDNSMVPINQVLGGGERRSGSDDDDDDDDGGGSPPPGPLGPLACLVVGLSAEELARFRTALHAIDADIVRLIPCPRAALEPVGGGGGGGLLALEDAVSLPQCPAHEPAPEGTPPVVFLSGMSGPEVAEIVRAYREDPDPPLPRAAFCALVPGNRRRSVAELVRSVWADEQRMREARRRQQEQKQQEQE